MTPSLFQRLISRPHPRWLPSFLGLLLLLASLLAAYLDGVLGEFFTRGIWRVTLSPILTLYILILAPIMDRKEAGVSQAFRPLVLIDDEEFERVLAEARRLRPWHEAIAFGVGAMFGLLVVASSYSALGFRMLVAYWLLTTMLMYGLLTWVVVGSVAETRVTAALHRQPLRVNLFDTSAFDAVGTRSLMIALAFIGGITLSLILGGYGPEGIHRPEFWLTYGVLTAAPILIFFLTMIPTHRVLADARSSEMARVKAQIHHACQEMLQRVEEGKGVGDFAGEIGALTEYERRLQQAKTWPYDTAKLSTLSISVLAPIATTLLRWLAEQLVR
jgi:hypothetical protein